MLTQEDYQTAGTKFCELMGIDPESDVKRGSKKLKAWNLAVFQIREHLAIQLALQQTLAEKPPPPPGTLRRIVKP